jgi:hypothetical protein
MGERGGGHISEGLGIDKSTFEIYTFIHHTQNNQKNATVT